MTAAAAALDCVSKAFGNTQALANVSYAAPRGSVLAILGPNGAGKTTSLSLLLGLRSPDSGSATLFGADPRRPEARSKLGATPQEMAFPLTLRVREIVELVRAHYERPRSVASVLAQFGLEELLERQTGGLSGGERRRLAVALAFVGSPELVVLDEPTTGLDIESRRATWDAIRSYSADGGTVLLTTHHLEEAETLASEVVAIDRGSVVARGSVAEIRARAGLGVVRFRSEPIPADIGERTVTENGVTTIYTSTPTETVRLLVSAHARLDELEVTPLSLEEALRAVAEDRG